MVDWGVLISGLALIVIPMVSYIWKSHSSKLERLDRRVTLLEKDAAVISTKLDMIDEKIDDIKKAIEKISR